MALSQYSHLLWNKSHTSRLCDKRGCFDYIVPGGLMGCPVLFSVTKENNRIIIDNSHHYRKIKNISALSGKVSVYRTWCIISQSICEIYNQFVTPRLHRLLPQIVTLKMEENPTCQAIGKPRFLGRSFFLLFRRCGHGLQCS